MSETGASDRFDEPLISIGVFSRKVGVSVSAVRRYESEGLIIAHRTRGGQRLFSQEDVSRVRNIQRMIQRSGLNIEGIRRMEALLPCWELHPCSEDCRDRCPAYRAGSRPCWMVKRFQCARAEAECRRCPVYRLGSLCTEEIKRLVHEQNGSADASEAIRALIHRKRKVREEG